MALRYYSNAPATTLTASASALDTEITVASVAGLPVQFPFTLILDRGTASEEAVSVTAAAGLDLTVTRAIDSTTAFTHSSGATVEHGITAQDIRESNTHINTETGVHGIAGDVVGTTDTQTLTNKTLTAPALTDPEITGMDWTPYTPTTTAASNGAGAVLAGEYVRVGKLIFFRAELELGTGFDLSTGISFSLPVTRASNPSVVTGQATLLDLGTGYYSGILHSLATTTASIKLLASLGSHVSISNTAPFTWAAGDFIQIAGWYEAAA